MKHNPKMPKRVGSGGRQGRDSGGSAETSGRGMGARSPHPNGGETRPLPVPGDRMARKNRTGPITHTDLQVSPDVTSPEAHRTRYSHRMPTNMSGGRQSLPRRR